MPIIESSVDALRYFFFVRLNKPEYFFRPSQALARISRCIVGEHAPFRSVRLPWGVELDVRVTEMLGLSVWHLGVFDLVVSEALWRLAEPAEAAADVGANIGYMSGLLARRLGPSGHVYAFEPHPVVGERLVKHASRWSMNQSLAKISVKRAAVSECSGVGRLSIPAGFSKNEGLASLLQGAETALLPDTSPNVEVVSLDDVIPADVKLGVVKLDVEGVECKVLRGAEKLLRRGGIRDIVFEEHGKGRTSAMRFIESLGFQVFRLQKSFWGPCLGSPTTPGPARPWEAPSFLATREPKRAMALFRPRGWNVLKQRLD